MNTRTDYRLHLKDLLASRSQKNEHYSVRALAQDLDVDNSYLVQLLDGKKNMPQKIAYKIAIAMKLEGEDLLHFIRPLLQ
jgi:plasmid maintenance system antidote protein VapI